MKRRLLHLQKIARFQKKKTNCETPFSFFQLLSKMATSGLIRLIFASNLETPCMSSILFAFANRWLCEKLTGFSSSQSLSYLARAAWWRQPLRNFSTFRSLSGQGGICHPGPLGPRAQISGPFQKSVAALIHVLVLGQLCGKKKRVRSSQPLRDVVHFPRNPGHGLRTWSSRKMHLGINVTHGHNPSQCNDLWRELLVRAIKVLR